jgi:hypothetical protein
MEAALEELCACLPELPADPVRAGIDPWLVARAVDAATTIIEATESDVDPGTAREQLWRALVISNAAGLSAQYYARDCEHAMCVGELAVLALLRTVWLARDTLAVLAPNRSMSELIDALQLMRTAFIERPFGDELVGQVELLEHGAARMLFETGTRGTFDLDDKLCRPTPRGVDEWMAAPAFLQMVWPTLLGFQRCLLEARCLLAVNEDAPERDPAAAARLRQWLLRRSEQTVYRDAAPSLKRLLIRLHMRPGDRELYRLQHPMVTASDAGIVADSLGDTRMSTINTRMYLSPSSCIRDQLMTPGPETAELGLCVHDFLDMLTQGSAGCEWARNYGRIDVEMNADEVQRLSCTHPFVVRLFNAWQLVYDGHVYWYNSIIDSIVAWLRVLAAVGHHSLSPTFRAAAAAPLFAELVEFVVDGREPARPADVLGGAPSFIV